MTTEVDSDVSLREMPRRGPKRKKPEAMPKVAAKRGPKPRPEFAALDLEATACIKLGKFSSTLEAAKAYMSRYYPNLHKDWTNEERAIKVKYINNRLKKIQNN